MKYKILLKSLSQSILGFYKKNKCFKFILLSLPLLIFTAGMIYRPNSGLPNDWDYFLQLYEAFRKTVIGYGQFPWWNPWVAGGVPLYANPQFGLISIQSILVLTFGTLYGLKISVVVYYLFGFWGSLLLFRRLSGKDELKSVLLAYIFTFSGFVSFHLSVGHLTFATYLLFPLLLFLFIQRNSSNINQICFILFTAFFINSAPHYIAIQGCLVLVAAILFQYIWLYKKLNRISLAKDGLSYIAITLLCANKLLFSLQYLSEFPREIIQKSNSFKVLSFALFKPYYNGYPVNLYEGFGWWEFGSYLSFAILAVLVITLVSQALKPKQRSYLALLSFTAAVIMFILAAGPFSVYAPYNILSKVPVFKSMIVPSRWLGWVGLFILISIAFYKTKSKYVYLLLALAAVELFCLHTLLLYKKSGNISNIKASPDFVQLEDYIPSESNRYFKGTLANIGEVRGYEPILGYDRQRNTKRTSSDPVFGIISKNAKVLTWSPNKIIIERLEEGPIELNVNPGNYWKVNGKRIFYNMKVTEPYSSFIINDNSKIITCEIEPSFFLLFKKSK